MGRLEWSVVLCRVVWQGTSDKAAFELNQEGRERGSREDMAKGTAGRRNRRNKGPEQEWRRVCGMAEASLTGVQ